MEKTHGRIICEKECAKEKNKNIKDYTLSQQVFNNPKYKGKFTNPEQVRGFIRYIRGHYGNRRRKSATLPTPLSNSNPSSQYYGQKIDTKAKVLLLDIETAPIMAFVWRLWKQNIGINQIVNDWFIFTWAAKWLFEDRVYSMKLTKKEIFKKDDKRLMIGIYKLLNEADIVITHNGKKFDIPKLNTRFIIHKMTPPLPYQQIDTFDAIKKIAGFSSNKQDFLNLSLGSPRKLDTGGFELWEKCYFGDMGAMQKMEEYNIMDVRSLEENYLKIRPFITPHPNMGLFIMDGLERCPSCGSNDLIDCGKDYYTTVSVYELRKCKNCGANSRVRKTKVSLKQKNGILSSSPR